MLEFKLEPISRDISLFVNSLSPVEISKQFAVMAAEQIAQATADNTRALGFAPTFTTYVDGRANAPLESVRPNGVIFTEYDLVFDALIYIANMLEQFSPVGTGNDQRPGHPGLYKRSHTLFADGVELDIDSPTIQFTAAEEYVFINTQPYARKIERGLSQQAPDGVYQAVALLARKKFGRVARITFTFRSIGGGERNPAILVKIGR